MNLGSLGVAENIDGLIIIATEFGTRFNI